MARYTLKNFNGNIKEYTNVHLDEIDKLTVEEDSLKLQEKLRSLQIDDVNDLRIFYNYNHKRKYLEVLDSRYSYIKRLNVKDGKIDLTDGIFRAKVDEIISIIKKNPQIYTAISNTHTISDKVKQYIIECVYNDSLFNRNTLYGHLSQYSQFRKLVLYVDSLLYVKETKEEIDEIDEIDPDEEMLDNWDKER